MSNSNDGHGGLFGHGHDFALPEVSDAELAAMSEDEKLAYML